jgi:hypothetical protein
MDGPVGGRNDLRGRQAVIDDCVTVTRDAGSHSGGGVNSSRVAGRQSMRPEFPIVEMVPGNKVIVIRTQP